MLFTILLTYIPLVVDPCNTDKMTFRYCLVFRFFIGLLFLFPYNISPFGTDLFFRLKSSIATSGFVLPSSKNLTTWCFLPSVVLSKMYEVVTLTLFP